jgi:hypothetical protein
MEYGAIDLHTKQSQIRIVTADGSMVVERRIATRAEQFAALDLPAPVRDALRPLTHLLDALAVPLREAETWAHQAAAADPVARRLMTAPGVGPVTALSYRATIPAASVAPPDRPRCPGARGGARRGSGQPLHAALDKPVAKCVPESQPILSSSAVGEQVVTRQAVARSSLDGTRGAGQAT